MKAIFIKAKFIVAALTLALALASSALGQSQSAPGAPKLVIVHTEHNFGQVKAGESHTHTFTFKNAGTADLLIKNVLPGCGCTAGDFTKVVPPGQEGKIVLTINTTGFNGAVTKHADVTTNDPQMANFTLSLHMVIGTAGPPPGRRVGSFIIGPSDRWSASIPRGNSAEAGINIYHDGPQPVRITKVHPGGESFAVDLETIQEGKHYVLRAKSSPSLAVGTYKQLVKLATEGSESPELQIQLEVAVVSPVTAMPKELAFGVLPISQAGYDISTLSKFIWVRQSRGGGLELKNLSASLPFIKVKVESQNDNQILLRVGFDPAKLTPGDYKGTVKIETTHPDAPVLEVGISVTAK
jgi:hypothetical protein